MPPKKTSSSTPSTTTLPKVTTFFHSESYTFSSNNNVKEHIVYTSDNGKEKAYVEFSQGNTKPIKKSFTSLKSLNTFLESKKNNIKLLKDK